MIARKPLVGIIAAGLLLALACSAFAQSPPLPAAKSLPFVSPIFGDNGTVTSITNNIDNGRTQTLAYDALNRISSATSSATSGVDCWGQGFLPDPLANLDTVTVMQCNAGQLSVTVDANNHINSSSAYAYDAAGNMTQDGSGLTYTFDAENRLTLAGGMSGGPYCFVYDGNNLRVAKKSSASSCSSGTVTKIYWRSPSGDALAETDGSGSTTNSNYNEYVFFAGRRVGSRNGAGTIFYWFADQLGTTHSITTGNGPGQTSGQLCYDADFTPYGQEMQHTEHLQATACPPNYRFTGYEYDSETGLDYAFARYYSSSLGRFLSTDQLGGSIGSLQSQNAYAYVQNNPLNHIDPLGLQQAAPGQCDNSVVQNCYGYGAGGGVDDPGDGGASCTVDGLSADCGSVSVLLNMGSAMQCPNNVCSGFNSAGQAVQFVAFATGGGYYPYVGYSSLAAAQQAGSLDAFNSMVASGQHQEWGDWTYEDPSGVYYDTPAQVIGPVCVSDQVSCEGALPFPDLPGGATIVGDQHSHPWVGDSQQFDFDLQEAINIGQTFLTYVTGPSSNGANWGLSPRTFVINPVTSSICQLPGSPHQFGIQTCP